MLLCNIKIMFLIPKCSSAGTQHVFQLLLVTLGFLFAWRRKAPILFREMFISHKICTHLIHVKPSVKTCVNLWIWMACQILQHAPSYCVSLSVAYRHSSTRSSASAAVQGNRHNIQTHQLPAHTFKHNEVKSFQPKTSRIKTDHLDL